MNAFWASWALWEKMCFILAVAIFFTIVAGGCKLVYNHWRIQKYSNVEELKRTHKRENTRQKQGNDIPFGVRAIESGVEVDGVWISRPPTISSASRSSLMESMVSIA
ncbi:MAG: hypothetical protein M1834_008558 [Cirrosporium novae-zelandiae]|nr:MAG: hypothetical protein M1834_008558 [Cirrosporium novae-zelandiae]